MKTSTTTTTTTTTTKTTVKAKMKEITIMGKEHNLGLRWRREEMMMMRTLRRVNVLKL